MQSTDLSHAANLSHAARELEELRRLEQDEWLEEKINRTPIKHRHRRFPPSCLNLLRGIDGNLRCADCDATNPQWATISYGALLCIECSGRHRQLGVQVRARIDAGPASEYLKRSKFLDETKWKHEPRKLLQID